METPGNKEKVFSSETTLQVHRKNEEKERGKEKSEVRKRKEVETKERKNLNGNHYLTHSPNKHITVASERHPILHTTRTTHHSKNASKT